MGPTNRGERVNNQQAWVKKGGANATERTGEGSDGEDDASRAQRRESGRGAGRGRNPRGRREPRDVKDGSTGAAVGAGATEDGTEGKPNNTTRGGRGGRGQRGGRRGAAAENATSDEKENANSDEVGDSGLSGGALLHMLKANPPKVTRYTKGELLSIARLQASKIKPPDLCPLIDKENKDSQLLIRITGGRSVAAGDEDGVADVATARRERRERRSQRGERVEEEEGEELRPRRSQRDAVAPVAPNATGPAAASSPSSPGAQQARVTTTPNVAAGTASEKLLTAAKTFQEEDLDAIKSQSRGFEKWFDRKKLDQTPAAGASTSVASGGGGATPHSAGATGAGLRDSTGYAASYLQQQAQALGQAHAMQAAAYMQTMSLHAAAAAASRSGGMPGSGNYPGWYNPYMFPYGGGHYSGYPSGLDYMSQAARNLTGGTGGGRGQQRLLGSGAAARGAASAKAVAAPKQAATPASPGLRPSPLSGAASLPMTAAKKTSPGPELTSAFHETPLLTTQLAKDDDKGEDEDPESCTQS